MSSVRCVFDAKAQIGESPIWDEVSEKLYWIDGPGRQVHRFDPNTCRNESWPAPSTIGSLALRETGGLIVALKDGFYFWDDISLEWKFLIRPSDEPSENRFNDGRVDPGGRFWAGTVSGQRPPSGSLHCLDIDLSCRKRVAGVAISNGLCWSPDGKVMYHADSARRIIWRYSFEAGSGMMSDKQVFFEVRSDIGAPDGAVTDSEGFVWIAMWGGWSVLRLNPFGAIDRKLDMPVAQPTCPSFGGKELRTLFITSARSGIDERAISAQPLAGGLFCVETDVRGVIPFRFQG